MPTTQHDVIKIPLLFKASYTSYRKEVKDIISNENAPLQSFRIKRAPLPVFYESENLPYES